MKPASGSHRFLNKGDRHLAPRQFNDGIQIPKEPVPVFQNASIDFLSIALCVAMLGLGILIAYSNSLKCPFIFDDQVSIETNPAASQISLFAAINSSDTALTLLGRPVVTLSFQLNHALAGWDLFSLHATNIAIHLLASLALFGVVRRTMLLPTMNEHYFNSATFLAAAISLLWAVHPIQTESVTYIVQRTESLAGMFYFVGVYGAIRTNEGGNRTFWIAVAWIACLLGIGSKEVLVTLPFAIVTYFRAFVDRSWMEGLQRRGAFYAGLFASWIPLGGLVILAGSRGDSAGYSSSMSAYQYLLNQPAWILWYLRLCFFPYPLTIDYGPNLIDDPLTIIFGWAGILALGLVLYFIGRRYPWVNFVVLSFVAYLAPTSSIIPLYGQVAAEHRMYIPLAGVITLAVIGTYEGCYRLWQFGSIRSFLLLTLVSRQVFTRSLLGVSVVSLICLTYARNRDYNDEIHLWESAERNRPSNLRAKAELSRIYGNRGLAEIKNRNYKEAITWLKESLRLTAGYELSHRNLGVAAALDGDLAEATESFSRALQLAPDNARTLAGRCMVHLERGSVTEAIRDFNLAFKNDPGAARFCLSFVRSLSESGQSCRSEPLLEAMANAFPHEPLVFWEQAVAFARSGRPGQAEIAIGKFKILKPSGPERTKMIDEFNQILKDGH